ncbi:MAG: hypothetical protein ACRBB6_04140 [Neptuniibacter sp.]
MTVLTQLSSSEDFQQEVDVLGGGGFLVESGVYDCTVSHAYYSTAQSGALALNLELKTTVDGQDKNIKQQFWMTSGTAKGCKTYYEHNGKKKGLPGFLSADSLALLTVGKSIGELATEEKVLNLYDHDAGKEIPTKVNMFSDLVGQEITAAVFKQTVDKTAKNDQSGNYEPTGETRDENEVDKFFRTRDGLTTAEIRGGVTEATFRDQWAEKWTGVTKNKAKGMTAAQAGVPGAPAAAASTGNGPKSLFAN